MIQEKLLKFEENVGYVAGGTASHPIARFVLGTALLKIESNIPDAHKNEAYMRGSLVIVGTYLSATAVAIGIENLLNRIPSRTIPEPVEASVPFFDPEAHTPLFFDQEVE